MNFKETEQNKKQQIKPAVHIVRTETWGTYNIIYTPSIQTLIKQDTKGHAINGQFYL